MPRKLSAWLYSIGISAMIIALGVWGGCHVRREPQVTRMAVAPLPKFPESKHKITTNAVKAALPVNVTDTLSWDCPTGTNQGWLIVYRTALNQPWQVLTIVTGANEYSYVLPRPEQRYYMLAAMWLLDDTNQVLRWEHWTNY